MPSVPFATIDWTVRVLRLDPKSSNPPVVLAANSFESAILIASSPGAIYELFATFVVLGVTPLVDVRLIRILLLAIWLPQLGYISHYANYIVDICSILFIIR